MDLWLLEDSNNSEHEIFTEIGGPTSTLTNHEKSSTHNDEVYRNMEHFKIVET